MLGVNSSKSNAGDKDSSLLNCNHDDVAARLGLPKGLIRTSEQHSSITQQYSNSLFGNTEDDNPAKRMRLNRERIAQRAVEAARAVVASKNEKATVSSGNSSSILNLSDRFSSSNSRK